METSSVKVFEIRNSEYEVKGGQELIFKINKNINLINQKDTFLKFNLRLGAKNEPVVQAVANAMPSQQIKYCLDRTIGAESLIKNLTIMTLDESVTLEQISNYNKLAKITSTYTDNSTHKNIKNLYEGRGDLVCLGSKNQLWELNNMTGANNVNQSVNTLSYKTIEICLPLRHSGILGGNDLYPNMLTGLCVKIQLEDDPYKILQAQGQVMLKDQATFNALNGNINRVGGYRRDSAYSFTRGDGNTYNVDGNVLRLFQNAGPTTAMATGVQSLGTGVITGTIPLSGDNLGVCCLPFTVGSLVKIEGSAALNFTQKITAIDYAANYATITLDANIDMRTNTETRPLIYITEPDEKPNLTLSNVELICGAVIPSDKDRNAYMNAVKSGYQYNYYSTQNYPVNNSADSTIISNLINCKLSKAKSILSVFEDLGTPSSALDDCLSNPITPPFHPNNYHYIIDNLKTPSRNVDLRNLNRTPVQPGGFNAVHVKELSDSFKECNKTISTLEPLKENFVIGRGLSRYNHTYNFLQQRGETRLNMQFSINSNAQLNHNFIYHWKQMVISPSGVIVNV